MPWAKALSYVGGQADVGGGQPVFAMNIPVMHAAHGRHPARIRIAIIPNELSHRPGLKRRPMRAQAREMPDQQANQLALAVPKTREQLAFFFRGKQIRGENRR